MNPNLSVIVPVYKVEPYIRQCLDSLINQTYRDMEIIVIDDGSPDNCGAICDEYAAKHRSIPQMRVIHKRNAGLSAARNQGIEMARGKWIAFVDSDDWCETDYYEKLFENLAGRTVDVFCSNGHIKEFEHKSVLAHTAYSNWEYADRYRIDLVMAQVIAPRCGELRMSDASSKRRISSIMGCPWDKLYRTEFIRNNRLSFDCTKKAWEDLLFNYQAFLVARRIAGCEVIGYHFRQNNASITHSYNPNRLNINYNFIESIRNLAPEKMESSLFRQAIHVISVDMMKRVLDWHYFHPSNPDTKAVVKRKIHEMTRLPYFHEALYESSNEFFTPNQIMLKHLLRQPFLWPLEAAFKAHSRFYD